MQYRFDFSAMVLLWRLSCLAIFGDGAVAGTGIGYGTVRLGSVVCSSWQSFLQEGRMLPHTGLFLLWKVALQMRIRRRLKNFELAPKILDTHKSLFRRSVQAGLCMRQDSAFFNFKLQRSRL